MTRSHCHQCTRDMLAHYFSPLHLFAPLIRYSYRKQNPVMRGTLWGIIRLYDRLFRSFLIIVPR